MDDQAAGAPKFKKLQEEYSHPHLETVGPKLRAMFSWNKDGVKDADEGFDDDLDEDEISDYISEHLEGNCLIAVGDEDLIKIHFHTNEPWKVLEYCNSIGEIYDIVVEDMIRQSAGLKG